MDDLEDKLKHSPLAAPSAGLDQRINEAFAAAGRRRKAPRPATGWWWTVPLATAAGLTAFFVVSARRPLPPPVTVYRVEAQGRMREMLVHPKTTREPATTFVFPTHSP